MADIERRQRGGSRVYTGCERAVRGGHQICAAFLRTQRGSARSRWLTFQDTRQGVSRVFNVGQRTAIVTVTPEFTEL